MHDGLQRPFQKFSYFGKDGKHSQANQRQRQGDENLKPRHSYWVAPCHRAEPKENYAARKERRTGEKRIGGHDPGAHPESYRAIMEISQTFDN
jgi:hypothetical protein